MIPPRERSSRRPCNIRPFISGWNGGIRERVSCLIRRAISIRSARGGVCLYGTDVLGADFQAGGYLGQSKPSSWVTGEQGCVVVSAPDQRGCPAGETQPGMAVPPGLGEFAELSTRSGLDPGYKVFASGLEIFAGRRTLFGRKVRPPSRSPTRALVLAKTNHCSQFALWSRRSGTAL
jgi:hypothetical protein